MKTGLKSALVALAATLLSTVCAAQAPLQPLAAKFRVSVWGLKGKAGASHQQDWYFYRDAQRVALIKGDVEDIWQRDAKGNVGFQRVFHADQRVADYSAGELSALQIPVDWTALSTFFDARELAAMKKGASSGRGEQQRVRYQAVAEGRQVRVDWQPQLQLPATLLRSAPGGAAVRYELLAWRPQAQAGWPVPGARSGDYLHVDSADFGDMSHDPFVKKAAALDVRAGWRTEHAHD